MKLIFHGAAREIGRSCIELQTRGDRYLLDCGVKFLSDGFDYPEKVFEVKELDGVLISHAHEDHAGALPFFEHFNLICPIFMTQQTKPINKIMLKDSYKIARIKHLHAGFSKLDLKHVRKNIRTVRFDKRYKFRKLHFTYKNAGHIPGSAMIKLELEGKTVLYTGDFNTRKSHLVEEARARDIGHAEILITESTYGNRPLPIRKPHEEEFLDKVQEIVAQGGRVLIPVFALGRAQEVLIMLSKRKWSVPIYYDGMAKQLTRKILMTPSQYVKNKDILNKMFFERVQWVTSQEARNRIATQPGIFVTTSGMLQGGPAIHYLKHMWHDEKSGVLLTGYQIRNTNGWLLSEHHEVYIKGWKTRVKCFVKRFDFSGHADRDDLHQFIMEINPKILIIQHGNDESCDAMLEWARNNLDCEVYAPVVGDEIEL